ncbi:hypothetical protein D3C86_1893600 [compost metagenome]
MHLAAVHKEIALDQLALRRGEVGVRSENDIHRGIPSKIFESAIPIWSTVLAMPDARQRKVSETFTFVAVSPDVPAITVMHQSVRR